MSTEKSKHLVPIFDGTNFINWRHRMANYLIEKDLEDVVGIDPTTLKPLQIKPFLTEEMTK